MAEPKSTASRLPAMAVVLVSLLGWSSLSLTGCGGASSAGRQGAPEVIEDIKTLLVLPFQVATDQYVPGAQVRCALCGTVIQTGPVQAGADTFLTQQLMAYLKGKRSFDLIPPGMAAGVRSQMISENLTVSERTVLLEAGKRLQANAVVAGSIYRFQQRVGGALSVETPASVAFDMHLIRVSDGGLLWSGHFDETQRGLSENLFRLGTFVKRGGEWLTTEQLAVFGLDEVMASFPVPQ